MDYAKLKSNELKFLIHLLTRLEKRLYLLRVSLYGYNESYFPDGNLLSKKKLEMDKDEFETKYKLSENDYRVIVDSCDIETCIRRIIYEMTNMKTYSSLKEIIVEFENERTALKKHTKMIEDKRKQIDQMKQDLSTIQEETKVTAEYLMMRKQQASERVGQRAESFDEVDFLKELMGYKIESKEEFYKHRHAELRENIEWFERETGTQKHADVQTLSFWLLKYDDCSEKLDMLLKQMFDNWAIKRRELEILKKYRMLNLEKIQKLHKLITERDDYIEKDRIKKETELKEREEELRKIFAATTLQAYWRGTMVRKHLGPYKRKKSKKGKDKAKKGKEKKKKK